MLAQDAQSSPEEGNMVAEATQQAFGKQQALAQHAQGSQTKQERFACIMQRILITTDLQNIKMKTMKIDSIHTPHLQNGEHFTFMSEVQHSISANDPAGIDIAEAFTSFQTALAGEDLSFKKVQKSDITKDLVDADRQRDAVVAGFKSQVGSLQKHFDNSISSAAYRIQLLLDTYGNLSTQSYDNETANLKNLMQELYGKYAADVATLGLGGWMLQMETLNNNFDSLMKERYAQSSDKSTVNSLRSARIDTDKAYGSMRDRLNAAIVFNGEAKYAKAATELNAIIKRYNDILTQRKGRSGSTGKNAPTPN